MSGDESYQQGTDTFIVQTI